MENNTPESNVNATINAVAGLVKEIPIYQDTVQPAAQEVGKSLHTVAKTINIALAPIKALVWGYDKIEEFITKRVAEKLEKIPEDNIITPDPKIAVPAIEALRYTGHDENLRELFANLISNSMDKLTVKNAHPGFVEVLKNLSSDEAILLRAFVAQRQYPIINVNATSKDGTGYTPITKSFSNFYQNLEIQNKDLISTYFDNLIRLGILEIPPYVHMTTPNTYEPIENDSNLDGVKMLIEKLMDKTISFERQIIRTTSFGGHFIESVVKDK